MPERVMTPESEKYAKIGKFVKATTNSNLNNSNECANVCFELPTRYERCEPSF